MNGLYSSIRSTSSSLLRSMEAMLRAKMVIALLMLFAAAVQAKEIVIRNKDFPQLKEKRKWLVLRKLSGVIKKIEINSLRQTFCCRNFIVIDMERNQFTFFGYYSYFYTV